MFNMSNIGLKISKMRKNAGITQMELADKLNISFQAVSSWERGQTMPDISKLHELSNIFNVSIDEILENKREAEIITAAETGKMPDEIPSLKEISEIGPILTPEQNDSIVKKIIIETKGSRNSMDLHEIASVAPFVSSELLDEIAEKAIRESGKLSAICPIAPFVSSELIDKLALEIISNSNNLSELAPIAPFVSSDIINSLAEKILGEKGLGALSPIIPFIDEKIIDNYIRKKYL